MEKQILTEQECTRLYIRYFDVELNSVTNLPEPVGVISFNEPLPKGIEIIPVVYITNECLKKCHTGNMPDVGAKILRLIQSVSDHSRISFPEIQIDCDWSDGTRDKYFSLLKSIHNALHTQKKMLSATIRLHQIKYRERTGIPPVDRGMLMFYNMGKLEASEAGNSIYDSSLANKYVGRLNEYPLPLDAALPIFGWVIQIRDNQIIALLPKRLITELPGDSSFIQYGTNKFTAKHSFFLHGSYIMKDDVLRIEAIQPGTTITAAKQLSSNLKTRPGVITLFDLDTNNLKKYHEDDFKKIYNFF